MHKYILAATYKKKLKQCFERAQHETLGLPANKNNSYVFNHYGPLLHKLHFRQTYYNQEDFDRPLWNHTTDKNFNNKASTD